MELQVCAIKAPGFGESRKAIMQDLAVLTGGQVQLVDCLLFLYCYNNLILHITWLLISASVCPHDAYVGQPYCFEFQHENKLKTLKSEVSLGTR